MPKKNVLIADTDRKVLKLLGNALHEREYEVQAARDGSRALEKTILFHPDLVLFDANCPMISPKKFIQILRSNPDTENIPVIIMGEGEPDESVPWGYREALIRKPFNIDEVLSLVGAIFRKMATDQEVREGEQNIGGGLSQISLSDLLQIFGTNRRTGLLELKTNADQGQIYTKEGRVVHATVGRHRGEKALFRMLQWKEGTFTFLSGKSVAEESIRRSGDALLLEGARQADEMIPLRAQLPGDGVRLVTETDRIGKYDGLHPVTQEIMGLLEFYQTVGDLIEHSRVSDYETCRAIQTLLEKGVLRAQVEKAGPVEAEDPLLKQEQLYELKLRLSLSMRRLAQPARGKICLLGAEERGLKELLGSMRKLPGMELSGLPEAMRLGFGHVGSLSLSDHLMLDIILLPALPPLRPLWGPFMVQAVGALVLRTGLDEESLRRIDLMSQDLLRRGGMPVMSMAPAEEEGKTPPGVEPVNIENPSDVRRVLTLFLEKVLSWKSAPSA
jgi:CheY-like chemotaxis protein